jgi:hypothetical protein
LVQVFAVIKKLEELIKENQRIRKRKNEKI